MVGMCNDYHEWDLNWSTGGHGICSASIAVYLYLTEQIVVFSEGYVTRYVTAHEHSRRRMQNVRGNGSARSRRLRFKKLKPELVVAPALQFLGASDNHPTGTPER